MTDAEQRGLLAAIGELAEQNDALCLSLEEPAESQAAKYGRTG